MQELETEIYYNPTLDLLVEILLLLFTLDRLKRLRPRSVRDIRLTVAGLISSVVSAIALYRANSTSDKVSPRDFSTEDYWDSLLFVQLVFAAIGCFSLVALFYGACKGLDTPPRYLRLLTVLPLAIGSVAAWLGLSNAAPLLDDYLIPWIFLLFLAFTITGGAISVACHKCCTHSFARKRELFLIRWTLSFATLLLGFRLVLLEGDGLPGGEIVVPLSMLFFMGFLWAGTRSWLNQESPLTIVLFLRRFGNTDLNATIVRSIGQWRHPRSLLIALDDQNLAPTASSRRPLFTAFTTTAAIVLPVGALLTFFVFRFSELFGVAEARMYGESYVIALATILVVVTVALFPLILYLLWALWRSALKRRAFIESAEDIQRVCRTIETTKGRMRRKDTLRQPRSIVVTTAHDHWRPAVAELMAIADTVVIDLSDISPNVRWELKRLQEDSPQKSLLLFPLGSENLAVSLVQFRGMVTLEYSSFEQLAKRLRSAQELSSVPTHIDQCSYGIGTAQL